MFLDILQITTRNCFTLTQFKIFEPGSCRAAMQVLLRNNLQQMQKTIIYLGIHKSLSTSFVTI